MQNRSLKRNNNVRIRIVITFLYLFLIEALIMHLVHLLSPMPMYLELLLDPSLLIILFLPMLYLMFWKPLISEISERNRAETAIRESEAQLNSILNSIEDVVWLASADTKKILFISSAAEKIYGRSVNEFYKNPDLWIDAVHKEDREYVKEKSEEFIKSGFKDLEYRIVRSDGNIRWLHDKARIVYGSSGQVAMMTGIASDITESKQAKKKIEQSLIVEKILEELSRLLFLKKDPDLNQFIASLGETVEANRAYIFRIRESIQKMDNTHEWCKPNTTSQKDNLQNISTSRFPQWMEKLEKNNIIIIEDVDALPEELNELKQILKTQEVRSLLYAPIKSIEGKVFGFMGFDDTKNKKVWSEENKRLIQIASEMLSNYFDRKIAERNLRESELKYRSVAQTASDAIIIANEEGHIISWNNGAMRIFGYSINEVMGKSLTMLMPERFKKAHNNGLKQYKYKTGQKSKIIGKRIELAGLKKDGSEFPLELSISTWKTGNKIFFSGIIHDISKRKEWEKELNEKHDKLKKTMDELKEAQTLIIRQEKLASIGTLSAGVAHEILNPLNIIGTIVQVLQMEELPGDAKDNMKEIMTQVKRATKITNNLRMFAHKKKPETTEVNLHNLFNQTATLIEHDMKLENITIKRIFDENLPLIQADEDQLAQIFLTFLNNAQDALKGRKNNLITVTTKGFEDHIEFIFSDNGPGMPQNIVDKVFDPFFTTKDPGQGTGLGLSIAYSIIEKHEGSIRLETKEGEGAKFVITLPVKQKS